MIKLSKRLKLIADFVDDGAKTIDIGCDHALLDIYLVKEKKVSQSIASDINESALNQAKINIKKHNLEGKIDIRLGDGLKVLNNKEVNTIIISGLGSPKIICILDEGKKKLNNINNIIIQSNSDAYLIRKKLTKLGYFIKDEKLTKENNITYQIILFKKGKKHYSKAQLMLGPKLLLRQEKLLVSLIESDFKKLTMLLNKIPNKYFLKRYKIKRKMRMLQKYKVIITNNL